MSWLVDKFKAPPLERRRMIDGMFKKYTYPKFTKNSADTYLYYRLIIISLWINCIILVVYGLGYLAIRAGYLSPIEFFNHNSLIESFIWTYPLIAGSVLYAFAIPYVYFYVKANIDFNKIDLIWLSRDTLIPRTSGKQSKIVSSMRLASIILVAAVFGGGHSHLCLLSTYTLIQIVICSYAL